MEEEVGAILEGWTSLRVQDFGPFTLIVGVDPYGTPRGGSRPDAIGLAHELREISEREARKVEAAPEPVAIETPEPEAIEPPPAPVAPVQPTEPEAVSASPVEVPEAPSAGDDAPPEQPPPAAVVTEPVTPAYAGTMLQEDRENYLRGVITVRVTQIERNRLEARYDANARERQRVGFVEYHNASDLGLPITDDVRAAYEEFLQAEQWVRATKDHADALRNAAITVGLDLLEAMQASIEEGWP